MTYIYEVSLEDLKNHYRKNIIMQYLLTTKGFNAFDLEKYCEGSRVEGEMLYLLVTDYEPVKVLGVEVENVEDLLEEYTIDELYADGFIKPITKTVINQYLSDYELAKDYDLDTIALDLLEDGNSFIDIVKAAKDIDLIDSDTI